MKPLCLYLKTRPRKYSVGTVVQNKSHRGSDREPMKHETRTNCKEGGYSLGGVATLGKQASTLIGLQSRFGENYLEFE